MTPLKLLLLLCLLLMPVPASAQEEGAEEKTTGVVAGRVLNAASREPVTGVNIIVVGTAFGAVSDAQGGFRIAGVPVGTYAVRASSVGFSPETQTDVVVNTARPALMSFELRETEISYEGVSVTAEYFRRSPDAPVSTQLQTNEEIRRLPGGFEDVVRAVSILPGVAKVDAGRNDLIVRGGAPSENLFVLDNIEVPNINHFGTQGASGGPLSFINLDFVRGTSFSTGGFGARYGDKLSSVLAIDLREGRNDRFGGKATVSATQFGLNAEGPLGSRGSALLSARRSYLDFIFRAAKFAFVPEYWDFLAKADYTLSAKDQLSLVGVAALDNVRLFNDTPDDRYDNSRILYSDQNTSVGGISWRRFFEHGYTTVTLGQSFYDYDTRQSDTLLRPFFRNASSEYESSLRGDLLYQVSRSTEVAAGLQGKLLRFRSDLFLAPFWTNYGQLLSVDARLDSTLAKGAAYVQVSQTLGRLRLTAGLRADYGTMVEGKTALGPRLSASYSLSPLTTLNASAGRYYQTPAAIWLVANPGNRKLSFIRADQLILGIDHALRADTRVSLEGYAKKYSGYPVSTLRPFLVMANTGAGYGGTEEGFASFGLDPLESRGSGLAHGVELFLQKKLSEVPCYGILSVSYNEARFTALDGVSRPGSFDQRWILNVGGGYVFNERWEVSMKFRLATGRPYTPYNPDGTQATERYNTERVGTNHSLDVRLDRRWAFTDWVLIGYIDIQNIYNKKPLSVPRYNERLGSVEDPESIGILPSIGISAEF